MANARMRSITRADTGRRSPLCLCLLTGAMLMAAAASGCSGEPKYGIEQPPLAWPGAKPQVWAVAPALNLSGQRQVDPLLQADLVYQQLQEVRGLTIIPVNRVVEVYAGLHMEQIQSPEQAFLVCDLLGCDGLVLPAVTAYDPYNPPKVGASLQLFAKPSTYVRPVNIDPHELARQATPGEAQSLPPPGAFVQAVGMFDAANGSVREQLAAYAAGRNDPKGPYQAKEYLVNMDRYSSFVYRQLVAQLLESPQLGR